MRGNAPPLWIRNDLRGKECATSNMLPRWLLIETLKNTLAIPTPPGDPVEACVIVTAEKVTLIFHVKVGFTDDEARAAMMEDPPEIDDTPPGRLMVAIRAGKG